MTAVPITDLRVRAVADRDLLSGFLRTDRRYAAYAIGDLEAGDRSQWGMAFDAIGRPMGLVMHRGGLVPQPLFLMGDPVACRAILESVIRPRDAYLQATSEHAEAITGLYELDPEVTMLRMVVDRDTFVPFDGPAERLTGRDIDELNRLYQLGFRTGFPPAVLADGVYFGLRVGDRLVSAAGTHLASAREGIAVVGNVMTHTEHRGNDYAKIVTSAVTADLLTRVPDVALNVRADNAPAVAAYARLGYQIHCEFSERLVRRRDGGWDLLRPFRDALRASWTRSRQVQ